MSICLLAGFETGDRQVLTAADTFGRMAAKHRPITWENHSLDEQRHCNIQCWINGSNSGRYRLLVDAGLLPERRAASCPDDFAKMVYALDVMLKPYLH